MSYTAFIVISEKITSTEIHSHIKGFTRTQYYLPAVIINTFLLSWKEFGRKQAVLLADILEKSVER